MRQRNRALPATVAACALASSLFAGEIPHIGPQIRIDVNGGDKPSNETSIIVSEQNPDCIVAAWNDYRTADPQFPHYMGVALSTDGGATWDDFLLRPPKEYQALLVEADPMTAYDPRTGTIWVGGFTGGEGMFVARKNPGAKEFEPSVMAYLGGSDKGWMAAGPRPNEPDSTRLYITEAAGIYWSDDLGDTWTDAIPLGVNGAYLPRVASNGTLYVAYTDQSDGVMLKRSTDGGATFTTLRMATRMDVWRGGRDRFPGTFAVGHFVYVDVDPNDPDTLYTVYFDTTSVEGENTNVDLYFTKSTDAGETWSTPRVISGDADPPGDQFFPWIEADREGRLHMVYMDSRHVVQDDNVVDGMFDNYYAWSLDGGDTWEERRLTPASYNSRFSATRGGTQFMGDYLGLAVAGDLVMPAYVDTTGDDANIYTHVIRWGPPGPGDVDGDGDVDFDDVLIVLANWGPCEPEDPCDGDQDDDRNVGFGDLLIVLSNWT